MPTFKLFLSILLFLASPLIADTPTTPPVEIPAQPSPEPVIPEVTIPSYEGAFLKMFLTLIALVVAVFFTVWALKRLSQGRLSSMNASRSIKILERRPLSPKTILYLVEVAGKRAMIAESQLEVKSILSFEDFTEPEKSE